MFRAFHYATLPLSFWSDLARHAADGERSSLAAVKKSAASRHLSMEAVNDAEWSGRNGGLSRPLLLKVQVLLDRAHASPGQIDADRGENTRKAIVAFREMRDLGAGERIDQQLWQALVEQDRDPALVRYTIRDDDIAGPFIDHVPDDFREKAKLKRLSYTSAQELLAEKFHMSERLLQELNPGVAFDKAAAKSSWRMSNAMSFQENRAP
jgi:hypothetical protein